MSKYVNKCLSCGAYDSEERFFICMNCKKEYPVGELEEVDDERELEELGVYSCGSCHRFCCSTCEPCTLCPKCDSICCPQHFENKRQKKCEDCYE